MGERLPDLNFNRTLTPKDDVLQQKTISTYVNDDQIVINKLTSVRFERLHLGAGPRRKFMLEFTEHDKYKVPQEYRVNGRYTIDYNIGSLYVDFDFRSTNNINDVFRFVQNNLVRSFVFSSIAEDIQELYVINGNEIDCSIETLTSSVEGDVRLMIQNNIRILHGIVRRNTNSLSFGEATTYVFHLATEGSNSQKHKMNRIRLISPIVAIDRNNSVVGMFGSEPNPDILDSTTRLDYKYHDQYRRLSTHEKLYLFYKMSQYIARHIFLPAAKVNDF